MSFSLRQLQFFLAAAEQGSVTGAARVLSISQSSVTEAVKALEADLGIALFEREPRGIRLTRAGAQFQRHARQILADVATARQSLRAVRPPDAPPARLSLGVSSLVAGYVLSDILSRFRRADPDVELSVIEDRPDYVEHLLLGGELDLAILVTESLRERAAVQVETLTVSPYRLWLPAGHRLTQTHPVALDDLSSEAFIQLSHDEIEEASARMMGALRQRPRIAFRTRSVEAVRSLVATGAGVTILPTLVWRPWSLEGDRIEIRDVSGDLPAIQVGLAWRKGAPLPAAARDFLRIAQGAVASRAAV